MSAISSGELAGGDAAVVLVCDTRGAILALTPGVGALPAEPPDGASKEGASPRRLAEVFGEDSQITEWLVQQMSEGQTPGDHRAQSTLNDGVGRVRVRIESLRQDEQLYGFMISIAPAGPSARSIALSDGDCIVLRKQWHEIKNHIGALKLYATFLTKKMAQSDDRQTVEKMLNGINVLIDYLSKVRRGEAQ